MSLLGKGLRWLLVLLAICAVVWTATIIWWQESRRAVDEADVLLFIVFLPLTIFAAVIGLRWLWRMATRAPAAVAATTGTASADLEADPAATQAESRWSMTVIASAVSCAAGHDGAALQAASLARKDLLKPSEHVFDGDGFRVPRIAVENLDVAAAEQRRQHCLQQDAARSDAEAAEAARLDRCVALLDAPLDEALTAVADWLTPPTPRTPPKPVRPSAIAPAVRATPPARLRALLLVSPDFSEAARLLLRQCVEAQLVDAARRERTQAHLEVVVISEPGADIRSIDSMMSRAHHADADDVWLLIGVDSKVDDQTLSQLERRDLVRTARKPQRPAAGEGAFVLALTTLPVTADRPPPLALLHRPALAARTAVLSEHGKVSSAVLEAALQSALAHAAIEGTAIARVISDVHGYDARAVEVASAMTAVFEPLDAVADRDDLGLLLGDLGAARVPGLLALATATVAASTKPCVVTSVAEALERHALVLLPPPEPDSNADSTSGAAASASS